MAGIDGPGGGDIEGGGGLKMYLPVWALVLLIVGCLMAGCGLGVWLTCLLIAGRIADEIVGRQ